MALWTFLEYAAWGLSALLAALMIIEWVRTDTTYSEEVLTSSREGELEAMTEEHKIDGGQA
mgnify:CR=1 FL=1|jgi:hypothetical protein